MPLTEGFVCVTPASVDSSDFIMRFVGTSVKEHAELCCLCEVGLSCCCAYGQR